MYLYSLGVRITPRATNQGATKLSSTQVGEAGGRRVSHVPSRSTHAPALGGCLGERNLRLWARGLPYVGDFFFGG